MKLAIIGSRDFDDYDILCNMVCTHFRLWYDTKCLSIVSGGARGADLLAGFFANKHDISITIFKAEWSKYGNKAGFIRNQDIIDECDMVLAFWDGKSRGTQDSINKAKIAKKPTFIVYF